MQVRVPAAGRSSTSESTGTDRTGLDQPVADENGNASLSYEDSALAIIHETETPQRSGHRITSRY